MPRISVIVPTFNCARYIGDALESILTQTKVADEIIVVDDGSTDATEQEVARFGSPRLRYLRKVNGGAASARNMGLAESGGEYIAFLDADDRWHAEMLATQGAILDGAPDVAFSFTNFERFADSSGASLGDQFRYYHGLRAIPHRAGPLPDAFIISDDAFCSLIQLGDFPAFTQAALFRRSAVRELRFNPSLRRCDDLAFTLQAAMAGAVAYTPRVLAYVRRHDANLTANSERMALDKLEALETLAPVVAGSTRLGPYRDRMVRAHLDASRTHLRFAELSEGVRNIGVAWTIPGSWGRKLKGAARFIALLPAAVLRRARQAHR